MSNIAVIVWSLYGHTAKLTEQVVEGVKGQGANVEVFQVGDLERAVQG